MGFDTVELVMEVEDEFDVLLSDAECGNVRNVGDLAVLVTSKLGPSSDGSVYQAVLEKVRTITADQFGVEIANVQAQTEFVKDLGA
jgi:acyl carrier protein